MNRHFLSRERGGERERANERKKFQYNVEVERGELVDICFLPKIDSISLQIQRTMLDQLAPSISWFDRFSLVCSARVFVSSNTFNWRLTHKFVCVMYYYYLCIQNQYEQFETICWFESEQYVEINLIHANETWRVSPKYSIAIRRWIQRLLIFFSIA